MPPPDHDAAHYQHYQYAAGQPAAPHPISAGATMEGHPMATFPPGSGGGGSRIAAAHYASSNSTDNHFGSGGAHHSHHMNNYDDDVPTRTVYKKAPGAPKRFKSSYVHFFTHYIEKKKHEPGPEARKNGCSCSIEGMLSDMEINAARSETILG